MFKKIKAEKIKDKLVNSKINVEEKDWEYTFKIDDKVSVTFRPDNEEHMILALPQVEDTLEKAYRKENKKK